MAQLIHTVAVGRVRYPAGTRETPELRELIDDRHWGEVDPGADAAAAARDSASQAEVTELRELAAVELAKRDARIAELEAEVERLTALAGAVTDHPPTPAVDYLSKPARELKDEIDRRNADRDPTAEVYIRVEPPGNKPELAAALAVDDARTA